MSNAKFVITDATGAASVWEESSPQDPTTVTVQPFGSEKIKSNSDNGPWTVSLVSVTGRNDIPSTAVTMAANTAGTSASIVLTDGSVGMFTVDIPES